MFIMNSAIQKFTQYVHKTPNLRISLKGNNELKQHLIFYQQKISNKRWRRFRWRRSCPNRKPIHARRFHPSSSANTPGYAVANYSGDSFCLKLYKYFLVNPFFGYFICIRIRTYNPVYRNIDTSYANAILNISMNCATQRKVFFLFLGRRDRPARHVPRLGFGRVRPSPDQDRRPESLLRKPENAKTGWRGRRPLAESDENFA